jgi:nucleotide-binding universal stress UspA family protein
MFPVRTILVPTDFSGPSAVALAVGTSLALDHDARLILLHVAGESGLSDGFEAATYPDEVRNKLGQLAARCPGLRVEQRLAHGKAVSEILRIATEEGCDLVVMGTHGRSGLRRVLLGSVADGVAGKAPCPVLTVRTAVPDGEEVEDPALAGAGAGDA